LVRIIFLRSDSSSDQIDLHLTEFQRTARPRSPFRLAIVGKVVAPVICRLGTVVYLTRQQENLIAEKRRLIEERSTARHFDAR
jgi:hypothetical protein